MSPVTDFFKSVVDKVNNIPTWIQERLGRRRLDNKVDNVSEGSKQVEVKADLEDGTKQVSECWIPVFCSMQKKVQSWFQERMGSRRFHKEKSMRPQQHVPSFGRRRLWKQNHFHLTAFSWTSIESYSCQTNLLMPLTLIHPFIHQKMTPLTFETECHGWHLIPCFVCVALSLSSFIVCGKVISPQYSVSENRTQIYHHRHRVYCTWESSYLFIYCTKIIYSQFLE